MFELWTRLVEEVQNLTTWDQYLFWMALAGFALGIGLVIYSLIVEEGSDSVISFLELDRIERQNSSNGLHEL